ncbi:MAG TPA: response regulator [Catalimonadaceae bacterium]|nr:response regulator [Catalimonadaceae bacterium]
MKKLILIDDEPLARGLLAEYLSAHPDLEIVAECENGFEGVKAIAQHRPDLIFLDIQMPKINGFEMLELLTECPCVIFTTAFDEYALKAFEANAIDYLLKPFSQDRLNAAIAKWRLQAGKDSVKQELDTFLQTSARSPEEYKRIVVKQGNDIRILPVSEVLYLEAYDDYVKVYTRDQYFLKKKTMNYYEEVLDPSLFFRSHRSFILNIQHLTRIETLEKNSYIGILRNGFQVPISRSHYAQLKERLGL